MSGSTFPARSARDRSWTWKSKTTACAPWPVEPREQPVFQVVGVADVLTSTGVVMTGLAENFITTPLQAGMVPRHEVSVVERARGGV